MRYKERIIEHNLHKPREYHTDTLKLQEVDFDPSVISHHPKSFEYYFTHGLVVNDRRYIVKEFFVKHGKLYAILTEDEDTYYEMYLSFLDENVIEDLKKDISDLKSKDKQFDKRLSDLENVRKQNQTLSISNRTISISNGNSIELPADKDTIYDDTALKERVKNLEDKPEKANQTLAINDRTISISDGNSIELPADKDTIYDDTALKERVKNLEDKPEKANQTLAINDRTISISDGNSIELPADKDTTYKVKGNGLFLDDDGTLHLEMGKEVYLQYPYTRGEDEYKKLSSLLRTTKGSENNIIYSINHDGTPQNSAVLETGILFDCAGIYSHGTTVTYVKTDGIKLSNCSTLTQYTHKIASVLVSKYVKIEMSISAKWKDDNNKVYIGVVPRLIWTVANEYTSEHYIHYITPNELESEEPIEIEIKKGESVVSRLTLTLKNTRLFMRSVQGTVLLKNPTDNKFYGIPRSN